MCASCGRADDVDNRIDRSDFVEVNLLDGHGMNACLCLAEKLKRATGPRLHGISKRGAINDLQNRGKRSMRLMRVFVGVIVLVHCAVRLPVFVGMRRVGTNVMRVRVGDCVDSCDRARERGPLRHAHDRARLRRRFRR